MPAWIDKEISSARLLSCAHDRHSSSTDLEALQQKKLSSWSLVAQSSKSRCPCMILEVLKRLQFLCRSKNSTMMLLEYSISTLNLWISQFPKFTRNGVEFVKTLRRPTFLCICRWNETLIIVFFLIFRYRSLGSLINQSFKKAWCSKSIRFFTLIYV